ncbi:MAG: hypothetical protein ACFFHV_15535 [Promethearchaeota archaeon]
MVKYISQNESAQRKTTLKIIEGIYNALEDGKFHTISEISGLAKSNWRTVKNQVDLVKKIQELPRIEIIEASKQILVRKL